MRQARDGRSVGERGRKTRDAILRATLKLIEEGASWRDLSVRTVMAEVGEEIRPRPSVGVFHSYFESIEEVTREVHQSLISEKKSIPKHLELIMDLLAFEDQIAADAEAAYIAEVNASRGAEGLPA